VNLLGRAELEQKLRDALVKGVAVQHQMDGLRKLHDAAMVMQNNELAMTYRQQMHDLLDIQLDTQSEVTSLTRSLVSF
jgi:hypothetical protein